MRSHILPLAFVITLAAAACSVPAQAWQPASPAITQSGAIEGAGAAELQAALARFYRNETNGMQTVVFVTYSQGYTGVEDTPYSIVSIDMMLTKNVALLRVGDSEVKAFARDEPRTIQEEILRLFERDRLYVIWVGTKDSLLWYSPEAKDFDRWMRKNVQGWGHLQQAKR